MLLKNSNFCVMKKKSVVYPVAFVAYVLLSLLLYWVWQGEITSRMLIGTCIIGVVILLLSEISIRVLGKKLKHSERNVENVPAKTRIMQCVLRNALMYAAIVGYEYRIDEDLAEIYLVSGVRYRIRRLEASFRVLGPARVNYIPVSVVDCEQRSGISGSAVVGVFYKISVRNVIGGEYVGDAPVQVLVTDGRKELVSVIFYQVTHDVFPVETTCIQGVRDYEDGGNVQELPRTPALMSDVAQIASGLVELHQPMISGCRGGYYVSSVLCLRDSIDAASYNAFFRVFQGEHVYF